ncbi:hypothetical protein GLA29479_615 [Lysobacter antibioticus]|nr:hypothetical protein GLA29479_615 [Lysobacter antibioticus]
MVPRRDDHQRLSAPAASLRQGQYYVGRWSTANLAAIESE